MIYKLLTKIWKQSLIYGQTWLSAPLTRIINSFWLKHYRPLLHTVKVHDKYHMVEFIFDLNRIGSLTPELLCNVFYTLKYSKYTSHMYGNIGIMLTANYDGDVKSLGGHFNATIYSTPDDFANH